MWTTTPKYGDRSARTASQTPILRSTSMAAGDNTIGNVNPLVRKNRSWDWRSSSKTRSNRSFKSNAATMPTGPEPTITNVFPTVMVEQHTALAA